MSFIAKSPGEPRNVEHLLHCGLVFRAVKLGVILFLNGRRLTQFEVLKVSGASGAKRKIEFRSSLHCRLLNVGSATVKTARYISLRTLCLGLRINRENTASGRQMPAPSLKNFAR